MKNKKFELVAQTPCYRLDSPESKSPNLAQGKVLGI